MIDTSPPHVSLTWEKYQALCRAVMDAESDRDDYKTERDAWESEVHQACDLLGVPKEQRLPGASGLMPALRLKLHGTKFEGVDSPPDVRLNCRCCSSSENAYNPRWHIVILRSGQDSMVVNQATRMAIEARLNNAAIPDEEKERIIQSVLEDMDECERHHNGDNIDE